MGFYPNNHHPDPIEWEPRTMEPCPYVATGTTPPGGVHDETCTMCKGTGEYLGLRGAAIRWSCSGCGLEGDREFFESCSCLGRGAGHYEELRALHEMGEHDLTGTVQTGDGPKVPWRLDKRGCPLCIIRLRVEAGLVTVGAEA